MKIIISCLKEIEQESRVLTGQQWSALRDAAALGEATELVISPGEFTSRLALLFRKRIRGSLQNEYSAPSRPMPDWGQSSGPRR